MSDLRGIVKLGRKAVAQGERLCLATVVDVRGSAYRKPGARMLLASGGERAGTISGGCLEAEVGRKAWWLTSEGARLERYSSFADEDGGMPYGLGCGGVVTLLLEQGEPVHALLRALELGLAERRPGVAVHALMDAGRVTGLGIGAGIGAGMGTVGTGSGTVLVATGEPAAGLLLAGASLRATPDLEVLYRRNEEAAQVFLPWAQTALCEQRSVALGSDLRPWVQNDESERPAYLVEYIAAPPALTVFGAGDDAQPIAALASSLGWRVTVADGRAHLARPDRFPREVTIRVLDYADPSLRAACGIAAPGNWQAPEGGTGDSLNSDDLAVILTHSYEQDRALLSALLPRPMRYLGILGPRHRTERLLAEVTPALGITLEEGFARLHSPVGLDLGSDEPAAVALSIVAEVQAVLHGRRVAVTRASAQQGVQPRAMAMPGG